MQLSAVTLIPMTTARTPLTPERLKDLILGCRVDGDRVEHVKVIERAGLMWIGAYVAICDTESADHNLADLCGRAAARLDGWEIMRQWNL
ncbi:hypothetical protein [Verrucosispora sp. WMMD573]|uniref:hypothetical protein n=1 Tax=Verrucosispora sp. WMMD573 TaxID=3015149 RepID=UPI00248C8F81|nr:hypothetical protein [Verrucosispora sp. WMMD573]WBB56658.1 hypothetical protein O7601_11640 [Verrucosispora sp. WMMD573]